MLKSTNTVSLFTMVARSDLPPVPTNVPRSTSLSLMLPEMGERTMVYPSSCSAWKRSASLIATDATALKAFAAGNDMRNRDKDYSTVGENAVYINVWAYEPGWTVTVTENGTPLDVKQVWSKKDPLHSISYDIPRGAANNGTLTFPSTSCMHMFEVTASSASSTLEISVTDRFGNVSTESMTRPKALTTDVTK